MCDHSFPQFDNLCYLCILSRTLHRQPITKAFQLICALLFSVSFVVSQSFKYQIFHALLIMWQINFNCLFQILSISVLFITIAVSNNSLTYLCCFKSLLNAWVGYLTFTTTEALIQDIGLVHNGLSKCETFK